MSKQQEQDLFTTITQHGKLTPGVGFLAFQGAIALDQSLAKRIEHEKQSQKQPASIKPLNYTSITQNQRLILLSEALKKNEAASHEWTRFNEAGMRNWRTSDALNRNTKTHKSGVTVGLVQLDISNNKHASNFSNALTKELVLSKQLTHDEAQSLNNALQNFHARNLSRSPSVGKQQINTIREHTHTAEFGMRTNPVIQQALAKNTLNQLKDCDQAASKHMAKILKAHPNHPFIKNNAVLIHTTLADTFNQRPADLAKVSKAIINTPPQNEQAFIHLVGNNRKVHGAIRTSNIAKVIHQAEAGKIDINQELNLAPSIADLKKLDAKKHRNLNNLPTASDVNFNTAQKPTSTEYLRRFIHGDLSLKEIEMIQLISLGKTPNGKHLNQLENLENTKKIWTKDNKTGELVFTATHYDKKNHATQLVERYNPHNGMLRSIQVLEYDHTRATPKETFYKSINSRATNIGLEKFVEEQSSANNITAIAQELPASQRMLLSDSISPSNSIPPSETIQTAGTRKT